MRLKMKYSKTISIILIISTVLSFTLLLSSCQSSDYSKAKEFIDSGNYDEAILILENLNDYEDSNELLSMCKSQKHIKEMKERIKSLEVGETFKLGKYEQDNNKSNGSEDIEWVIIAKSEDNALAISNYVIECLPYNEKLTSITWENSSIRKWLNESFVNSSFDNEEIAIIQKNRISADANPTYNTPSGNDTTDAVFLLSVKEAYEYLSYDSGLIKYCPTGNAFGKPTEYAQNKGVFKGSGTSTVWWLRTPGDSKDTATYVFTFGDVTEDGVAVNQNNVGVRPAIWIEIN